MRVVVEDTLLATCWWGDARDSNTRLLVSHQNNNIIELGRQPISGSRIRNLV